MQAQLVTKLEQLLPALNETAASPTDTTGKPVDRHIAAFIAARAEEDVSTPLAALGQPDPAAAALAMASTLAWLQQRHPGPAVHLARWLGRFLTPAYATFHHRARRKTLENAVQVAIDRGDLVGVHGLLSDPECRQRDADAFEAARGQYAQTAAEIRRIDDSREQNYAAAQIYGARLAAAVGCAASMLSVGLTMALFLS